MNQLAQIINEHSRDLAFVFGNGINYRLLDKCPDWKAIMQQLWRTYAAMSPEMPQDIALPEIGNMLENPHRNIQQLFCKQLNTTEEVKSCDLLCRLQEENIPIMTTNYDLNIETSLHLELKPHFCGDSASLRWNSYFGESGLRSPFDGFGVWHVHGDMNHQQAMCVTQTDYVTRIKGAYSMLNHVKKGGSTKMIAKFNDSWFKLFLNKSLCFIGLTLGRDEIFLRWLLLVRMKNAIKNGIRPPQGWYLYNKNEKDSMPKGLELFLECVGITPVPVDSYDELYIPA